MFVKSGDTVLVTSGRDKGKKGKVEKVYSKLDKVLVTGVNLYKKHLKGKGMIDISAYQYPGENFVVVEIRDTGFGIPIEEQSKIFQKFFRAGTKGTEDILGTGLGLFIVRMLVEKMGGKITFSSVEQEGTTFTFKLPIAPN